ncbi:macro domain-containing protein [Streptomyces sp. YIM S03343]
MPQPPHLPDHGAVLAEVRTVRRAGVVRLRGLDTPELTRIARERPGEQGELPAHAVERLLRDAVGAIGGGTLQTAAEYSLGLAQGTRDWPAADRRRRAAEVYGVSVERFRKHQELMVLGQITEQLLDIASRTVTGGRPGTDSMYGTDTGSGTARPDRLAAAHRVVHPYVHNRTVPVTLHVHSVDLLRDVDVVVSPSNTHFALPATYKSSIAATLRRAGARTDPTGALVEDLVHDELRGWAVRHGTPGRAALPGTVAATSSGTLADQGVRRIYHVAVAVPRPGTNDYDVQPADITRGVTRVFRLLAEETERYDPPLTSLCLPLLGAGRGGLPPLESFGALWAAVEAELARGADWDVHLVVRRHARADLLERLLSERRRP